MPSHNTNPIDIEPPPMKNIVNADKKQADDVLEALGDHASVLEEQLLPQEDRRILRKIDLWWVDNSLMLKPGFAVLILRSLANAS